jgi:uridine kinase
MQPTSDPGAPLLVAIVGGSGAGKSWLGDGLQRALAPNAGRLSLDDFYRDRSHLSPARRARINFDHPNAIDWPAFRRVLRSLRAGRPAKAPLYDFQTHCRLAGSRTIPPKPIILVDGLWLLRSPEMRHLFAFCIFVQSPARTRLRRRLCRDVLTRGRTHASIAAQFRSTVEPMHLRFVEPQASHADIVLPDNLGSHDIKRLVARLKALLAPGASPGRQADDFIACR